MSAWETAASSDWVVWRAMAAYAERDAGSCCGGNAEYFAAADMPNATLNLTGFS